MFESLKIAIDKGTRKHKAHVAHAKRGLKPRGIKRKPGKKNGAGKKKKKKNGNPGFAKKEIYEYR